MPPPAAVAGDGVVPLPGAGVARARATAAGSQRSGRPVRVSPCPVALSSSSVYPLGVTEAFEMAARLGYDGVEVMVWTDPLTQDAGSLSRLSARYGIPVLAVHAPTLLVTQRVWGREPWAKITGAVDMAAELGAPTVVAHPPFRWQREYALSFVDGVRDISRRSGIRIAVENMFPWRARSREVQAYLPGWDPTESDYDHVTLDLSHCATAGTDSLAMARQLGSRLAHVHLTDGSGSSKDEHLVPGRGTQPAAALLGELATGGWQGTVVVEVNTRRSRGQGERELDIAESLAFARLHLAAPAGAEA